MRFPFLLLFALFFGSSVFSQETSPKLQVKGFSHPESVVYDENRNVLYVSNIGGKKQADGFISKVSPEGKILQLKWIDGLQDPKGLWVEGNRLFVTDRTVLVEMDIEKREIQKEFSVDGAQSLNDIAGDGAGNIYFSDLSGNSIFKRSASGEITEWLHDAKLQQPNGLLVDGDKIYVSGWGKEQPGNLLQVDLNTKEIEVLTQKGIGNLDGLQKKDEQNFYVSDWGGGKVYVISKNGKAEEKISAEKSVGDILFFEKKDQLILPMNHQNALWIYDLD